MAVGLLEQFHWGLTGTGQRDGGGISPGTACWLRTRAPDPGGKAQKPFGEPHTDFCSMPASFRTWEVLR